MSTPAASSSSSLTKSHEEESTEEGIMLPELRTSINAAVGAVKKQMQSNHPIGPKPKKQQISAAPRTFHPFKFSAYPLPLATHEELVQNRELFFSTLTELHVSMGTKLTIPKIGGKDLDLHLLYREVTARGGLQMVINERKWKEITVVLNFPSSTTSASFVLRKYYTNLLHHYEQVHFFQVQGPLVPPPVPAPNINPAMNQTIEANYKHPALEDPQIEIKKQKIDSAQVLGVDPAVVTGFIDGKFEHAYLVTVMVGTRKMRGVLYHVPPSGSRPQVASVSNASQAGFRNTMAHRICSKQKRKEICRKDPNAPRQNRTGYNFFFAEQRAKFKSVQPDKDRAISKMIGNSWNRLSEDEKSPYQERGLKDKERYKREMSEYRERLRFQSSFRNNSHMACKYGPWSSDSRNQVQKSMALQEKPSCISVTQLHHSTEEKHHPVTATRAIPDNLCMNSNIVP